MAKNLAISKMNMFQQYLGRVKKNIHFIIAMSPLGELFRTRLRKFPSLVNCCTLDWFSEWPEEALMGVALGALTETDLELKDFTHGCVEMMKFMHQSVEKKSIQFLNELRRRNYVTPTSYLELLNMYKSILVGKRTEIMFAKNRLVKGLEVLAQAAIEVEKLEIMLVEKQPELEATKKDVEITKKQLGSEVAAADEERKLVAADEAEATQQEAEANALMDEAQTELGKAKPLLEEAVRVLNSLKVDDFYVLSSINNPTPTVVLGMELSCVMMQLKPKKNLPKKAPNDTTGYFDCAKSNLLNEPKKFMQRMIEFDKNNI
jgi:dynein heavy chain